MANFGEDFELSKWFNGTVLKSEAPSTDNTDNEDGDASSVVDRDVVEAECYICRMPNPEYMSTNTVKKAPPVPVCSTDCEAKYLDKKGLRPTSKSEPAKMVATALAADPYRCFVCHAPNPEYISTDTVKDVPSVPVCSMDCESKYLKQKGLRVKGGENPTSSASIERSSSKKAKREELDNTHDSGSGKRRRVSLSFLDDHLLESDGYRSWWLGALTFYDFVYQRHGMWHSYSITNNEPRVDPCLIKFATCNIYRELDRSTAYLRKHVLRWQHSHHGSLSSREVLWMAVVFRFCNKLDTFDKAKGIPNSDEFPAFKKTLQSIAKRNSKYDFLAGNRDLSLEVYLQTLHDFLENIDLYTFQVKRCTNIQEIFEVLRKFNGNALGSFTCWQVVCDLIGLNMLGEDVVEDEFVWLTADAKKSLVQIFGKNRARPSEYIALARLLQQRQIQGFKALQVKFPFFMNQKLDLKNIGHALHGFQTYRNIKLLEKKLLRKYEPDAAQPALYNSRSHLMDNESCEVCSLAENEGKLMVCDLCNRLFHNYCIRMKELPPASWVCAACKKLQNYPEEGLIAEPEVIDIE